MSEQTYCVIFNCQDTSTTIRVEKDLGDPSAQTIDLTAPGTDYRAVYGLSAEGALAEADALICAGYGTQYRVF